MSLVTPIDRYLAEQQDVSAVERFARHHDADLLEPGHRWYADRLPASPPAPGEQYAFRVDLDRCTGCKACVAACHSLNGLDEGESWRSVGQLVGTDDEHPRQQHVPTGCHHCVDPACLSGCPTNAYEKDPFSGIVRHLDDQCIGCSYCELTCPYEVPKLNPRLGIVRKCDMCADRLGAGEAPACVQACPTSAITITTVATTSARADAVDSVLVPGAPASAMTIPTTRYVGGGELLRASGTEVQAADHHAVHPSRSHPPLAAMLVLTQLSVGAFLCAVVAGLLAGDHLPPGVAVGAAAAGVLALAASVLHLGRPLMAWRAVLGLGHSWLSREIVAFGVYAVASVAYAATTVAPVSVPGVVPLLGATGVVAGVGGVTCSALIYVVTRRPSWRAATTFGRFVGTAVATGPLLVVVVVLASASATGDRAGVAGVVVPCLGLAVVTTAAKVLADAATGRMEPHRARLLRGPLAPQHRARLAAGVVGGLLGPLAVLAALAGGADAAVAAAVVAGLSFACSVAGELIERYHFFVTSSAPRMPGAFS